jgi:hypothetical protein
MAPTTRTAAPPAVRRPERDARWRTRIGAARELS